jgi:hypothetical protein
MIQADVKKIGEYDSFLFDDHLIISLDKNWIKVFGELPRFEVTVDDDGKLHITSIKSIESIKST